MSAALRPVLVTAAAALSRFGPGWRDLAQAVRTHAGDFSPASQLQASHGAVPAAEVPPLAPEADVEPRARKLMAYPARLAAVALRQLLHDTGWDAEQREACGFYLGVGASGAHMQEINAMLAASIEAHTFDLARFGQHGLAACNPLFAFQLMNNFTMCHGAIQSGIGGPNSALFSRGTGTHAALAEAHWLLASGGADWAIAGGADSALHPATWSQLQRDGFAAQGLVPGEGAALLALGTEVAAHRDSKNGPESGLQSDPQDGPKNGLHRDHQDGTESDPQSASQPAPLASALASLEHCEYHSAKAWQAAPDLLARQLAALEFDGVVLAPWGKPARVALLQALARHAAMQPDAPPPQVLDANAALGESLAASPALAWCVALDWLHEATADASRVAAAQTANALRPQRVLVLSAGIDGGFGLTVLRGLP